VYGVTSGLGCVATPTVVVEAVTVQIEGMTLDVEVVDFCDHILDTLYPWVTKFQYLLTVETDQVVVLPVSERRLVLGALCTKLVPYRQVAVH